nr:hypothetical protein [Streptomyces purpureus]
MDGARHDARRFGGIGAASTTAVAGLVAVGVFVVGCSTGGTGSRDEGAASRPDQTSPTAAVPSAPASSTAHFKKVDAARLIKSDPKVSDQVKADLKPCVKNIYPVDTSYGNLTGGPAPDVIVNVMTCGDAVGIGTYVYREEGGEYRNVFATEDAAVYATIDRGDLVVTKQVYAKGDPVAYPSGEDVITYRWSGSKFTQHDWVHNDYSKAVGDGGIDSPSTAAPSEN